MKYACIMIGVLLTASISGYAQDSLPNKQRDLFLYRDKQNPQANSHIRASKISEGFANTLVIIDNKIFDSNSSEVHAFKLSDLELIQTIVDTASTSSIKRILIYRKKINH